MSYDDLDPTIAMMATQQRHVIYLQHAMQVIRHDLETRALVHDASKLGPEELPGFVRINATARNHPYGSAEYRASIKAERPAVEHHQMTNRHHPEYWILNGSGEGIELMTWLDIAEMVCDWWAANKTYGTTTWEESLRINLERWPWSAGQKWLIQDVSRSLNEKLGGRQ